MGQLEQEDTSETVGVEEQKRTKQMKVVEELVMTETRYCDDISKLLATMQSLQDLVCFYELDSTFENNSSTYICHFTSYIFFMIFFSDTQYLSKSILIIIFLFVLFIYHIYRRNMAK